MSGSTSDNGRHRKGRSNSDALRQAEGMGSEASLIGFVSVMSIPAVLGVLAATQAVAAGTVLWLHGLAYARLPGQPCSSFWQASTCTPP